MYHYSHYKSSCAACPTKSTIRNIPKNENEKAIQERIALSAVPSTKVVTQVQDAHIERMEKALGV